MARSVKGSGSGARSWVPKIGGSAKEAEARAAEDKAQRTAAGKSKQSVILSPRDVQEGQYDAIRALKTTLGSSIPRDLTTDDLAAFRHNVRQVQKQYTAGIRARQVLDFSLAADRARANKEITAAVPVYANGGKVRFVTPASKESKLTHHYVHVDFMSFGAMATGAGGDAKTAALRLRRAPLKIECDCGRWRYWYRYIATIGKFNAGRDETGFPKIRNPGLHGIACKHILRVMAEVESSGTVLAFLTRLIDTARGHDFNEAKLKTTQQEAEKIAAETFATVREKDTRWQSLARRSRERAAILKASLDAKPPSAKPASATRSAEKNAQSIATRFGIALKKLKDLF